MSLDRSANRSWYDSLSLTDASHLWFEKERLFKRAQEALKKGETLPTTPIPPWDPDDIVGNRRWEASRLEVECKAARIAYFDCLFRSRDFDPKSACSNEKKEYELWLYGGPKPLPNPLVERAKWRFGLVALQFFLLIGAIVALIVSAFVVGFFHEAGFLAVLVYWFTQWRRWRALRKLAKLAEEQGNQELI